MMNGCRRQHERRAAVNDPKYMRRRQPGIGGNNGIESRRRRGRKLRRMTLPHRPPESNHGAGRLPRYSPQHGPEQYIFVYPAGAAGEHQVPGAGAIMKGALRAESALAGSSGIRCRRARQQACPHAMCGRPDQRFRVWRTMATSSVVRRTAGSLSLRSISGCWISFSQEVQRIL